jgi:hypothetical protein
MSIMPERTLAQIRDAVVGVLRALQPPQRISSYLCRLAAWSRPAGVIAVGLSAALLWLVPTRGAPPAAPVIRGSCS